MVDEIPLEYQPSFADIGDDITLALDLTKPAPFGTLFIYALDSKGLLNFNY